MLAAVPACLFSPTGLCRNSPGVVRAGAVQHGGGQTAAGNLKQLGKHCCACAHCGLWWFTSDSLAPSCMERGRLSRFALCQAATADSKP